MKRYSLLLSFCVVFIVGLMQVSCRKKDASADPATPPDSTEITSNIIADHLRFLQSTKKVGQAPKGPSTAALKISLQDTLYLSDEIKRPIKFKILDTLKNVAGAYFQVSFGSATNPASYYYDVPEVAQMQENDSVSVVMIGIDPNGLVQTTGVPPAGGGPFHFGMTITPYDASGQPLGQIETPVKVGGRSNNPKTSECGLVVSGGDFWLWDLTLIESPDGKSLVFYNDDEVIWGKNGQMIKGCCRDGKSSYDINCSNDVAHQRSLNFDTRFGFTGRNIQFFANGDFDRYAAEYKRLPEPQQSNFCGTGPGVTTYHQYERFTAGTWQLQSLPTPFKGDSIQVTLRNTKSSGEGGVGITGGIIHEVTCNVLVLIVPDREGGSRHEVTFLERRKTNDNNDDPFDDGWYVAW